MYIKPVYERVFMKKYVTFTIEEDVKKRLAAVAKRAKMSQSAIVEEVLVELLPILEAETANQLIQRSLKKLSESIDNTASLFDVAAEHDQSVEDYKDMKRG